MENADGRKAARKKEQGSRPFWLQSEGSGQGAREEMKERLWLRTERGCAHWPAQSLQAQRKAEWQGAGPRRRRALRGRIPEKSKNPGARARPGRAALRSRGRADLSETHRCLLLCCCSHLSYPLTTFPVVFSITVFAASAPAITAKWSILGLGLGVRVGARRKQYKLARHLLRQPPLLQTPLLGGKGEHCQKVHAVPLPTVRVRTFLSRLGESLALGERRKDPEITKKYLILGSVDFLSS